MIKRARGWFYCWKVFNDGQFKNQNFEKIFDLNDRIDKQVMKTSEWTFNMKKKCRVKKVKSQRI